MNIGHQYKRKKESIAIQMTKSNSQLCQLCKYFRAENEQQSQVQVLLSMPSR
jgi:hypothetical protein